VALHIGKGHPNIRCQGCNGLGHNLSPSLKERGEAP
jgi:hypothetical protein